jgi:hypothetical protein
MDKRFITFETVSGPSEPDLEQDAIKPLFVKIVDDLQRRGANITELPTEWDAYGWYADFQVGSAKLTCMMQRSDSWLLLISSNRSLIDKLKGRHHELELSEFAGLVVAAVQEAVGVPAKLFNSEAELRAG